MGCNRYENATHWVKLKGDGLVICWFTSEYILTITGVNSEEKTRNYVLGSRHWEFFADSGVILGKYNQSG